MLTPKRDGRCANRRPIPFRSRNPGYVVARGRCTLIRVSLAQIEYFVAVAREGRVARAAASLRVAQPAVSRQIRKLEDELQTPLFERTPRGMRLSPAGVVFLEHAREILGDIDAAREAVRRTVDRGEPAS
jgi:hypothetical protein